MAKPLISRQSGPLKGSITPPGDKSISHRAVMLGGCAAGVTTVRGLLEGEDVLCTVAALRALGADIRKEGDVWRIESAGLERLHQSAVILDMGNSGTAARLLIGLLGGRPFTSYFSGDESLRERPMGRVTAPLELMGARFMSREGVKLPLAVMGPEKVTPISYALSIPSAQVKSAILLAGLSAEGTTTVYETALTRDHTERMLRYFGASVTTETTKDGAEAISLVGQPYLTGQAITVPADISSAAFPLVAALLRPGSAVTLLKAGVNPRRAGLVQTLQEMGADIALGDPREESGEPVADLTVKASALKGITVPAERAPSMIDEYPILAMAAACAKGTTRLCGLGELRVKESDRLTLVAEGLTACGARVEIEGDDLIIHGNGKPPLGGATVKTSMDHRIAMSFLVLGMAANEPVRIDDSSMIATSFPRFVEMMNGLGSKLN
jgi:3-phosphoshikimate 1-carboxyvinyltransferase